MTDKIDLPPIDLSDEAVGRMSPDDARATLAEMQRRHDLTLDRKSPDAILKMTPAEATAALEAMRPVGADGKPIPEVPFSGIISSVEADARRAQEAITSLEEAHFPPRGSPVGEDLWAMLNGQTPIEPGLQQKVEAKLRQFHADKNWCRLLMEGDPATMRAWHTATALLTACQIHR